MSCLGYLYNTSGIAYRKGATSLRRSKSAPGVVLKNPRRGYAAGELSNGILGSRNIKISLESSAGRAWDSRRGAKVAVQDKVRPQVLN